MKLREYTCGLFPYFDYHFPEGDFKVPYSNKKFDVQIRRVSFLDKTLFEINSDLLDFYSIVLKAAISCNKKIEYDEDRGILIYEEIFKDTIKSFTKSNDKLKTIIYRLSKTYFHLSIRMDHDINNQDPLTYINEIRDEEGVEKVKKKFFKISRKLHEIVMISRSPYTNTVEVNFINLKGVYGYFCNEKNESITQANKFGFSFWEPQSPNLKEFIDEFLISNDNIPITQLLISKSKVYWRLGNYSMAIVHIVIALDKTVPQFLNTYLKHKGVDKSSIEDFNNKFGLSVRVKALLKMVLPKEFHNLLSNVGSAIKLRNKIIHEGLNDEILESVDIEKIIDDCTELINILNTRVITDVKSR